MLPLIKVSAKSRSTAVAGAIAGVIREHHRAEVQTIGASAVNQAVKAIAIARNYLERDGLDIACVPTFVEVDLGDEKRTAVKFAVEVTRTFTPVAPSFPKEKTTVETLPATSEQDKEVKHSASP